ncbi:sensor histidine kinase [Pedobacter mucosus]|uniref:sensor histidine kinase n=1 Tax=Pedobacter mucosus TaxID=2895286 RepID=UPI001EE4D595|nr:terminase TerL endonuclease subunit [Pedobacter mucosus]UKT65047.1 histidine kinase [Pedobacter mucosus]
MVYQKLCKRVRKFGIEPFVHGLFWLFFIGGEIYSLSVLTGRQSTIEHYFFFYLLNIILFYSYVWLLIKIPHKGPVQWIIAFIIFVFVMAVYVVLAAFLTRWLTSISNQGDKILAFNEKFYVSTIWRGVYFTLFATGYFLVKRHAKLREAELEKEIELERVKNQLVITEKNFLRSQINPHLLFNTINFIKHAIKHDPANASIALTNLSDIMDYALDNSKKDFVYLSEEIEQIENMVQLNRLRFGKKLVLEFNKEVFDQEVKIIPLILLTIVENVFKHANLTDKSFPVYIEITTSPEQLTFRTSNYPSNNSLSKGSRTGLQNISQRLSSSYPAKHEFQYGLQGERFSTELTIYF